MRITNDEIGRIIKNKLSYFSLKHKSRIWSRIKKFDKSIKLFVLGTGYSEYDRMLCQVLNNPYILFITYNDIANCDSFTRIIKISESDYEQLLTYYSTLNFYDDFISLNLEKPYGQFSSDIINLLNLSVNEIVQHILGGYFGNQKFIEKFSVCKRNCY